MLEDVGADGDVRDGVGEADELLDLLLLDADDDGDGELLRGVDWAGRDDEGGGCDDGGDDGDDDRGGVDLVAVDFVGDGGLDGPGELLPDVVASKIATPSANSTSTSTAPTHRLVCDFGGGGGDAGRETGGGGGAYARAAGRTAVPPTAAAPGRRNLVVASAGLRNA